MAKRRKMSAKQRKYFGGGRTRRARGRSLSPSRRRRSGSRGGGLGRWIPGTMNENLVRVGSGFSMPFVSGFVAPWTDPLLAPLGRFKDEARTAVIGTVLYGLGSGFVRDGGKAYWDYALTGGGIELASRMSNGTNAGESSEYY